MCVLYQEEVNLSWLLCLKTYEGQGLLTSRFLYLLRNWVWLLQDFFGCYVIGFVYFEMPLVVT